MGDSTTIEWTDATWNVTRGCRRTAPEGSKQSGCGDPTGGGCYAERQAARFCGKGGAYEGLVTLTKNGPRWSGRTKFVAEHLADPLRWRKPRRIFVDSMSDLFYEEFRDTEIAAVFGVMAMAPQHTFQVLTKRAERMRAWFDWIDGGADAAANLCRLHAEDVLEAIGLTMPDRNRLGMYKTPPRWPLPNVWLGVSVENQAAADTRIGDLCKTPAAVRFLSCEPLLGPITLPIVHVFGSNPPPPSIGWVIAGCESGPGARAAHVDWYRALRDQCADVGLPFFLKQATAEQERCEDCGELVHYRVDEVGRCDASCGCTTEGSESCDAVGITDGFGSHLKGRGLIGAPYLDGVQHLAFPETTP